MSIEFKNQAFEKYKDLKDSIKENLVVDGNKITEKESHLSYYDNLPEGISKKQVEDLSKYNSKFVTASHVAIGELASDIFLKDESVEEVNTELGFFGKNDKITTTVHRTKTYMNHLAKEGESKEVVKHLVMNTTVNSMSSKGYGLKSIRNHMSEEFTDMFKK